MQATRQGIQQTFSSELQAEVRKRYRGKLPSAAAFAAHFNLQIRDPRLDISQETARRWLRGQCLPDAARMHTLAVWLGMDLNRALSCGSRPAKASDAGDQEITNWLERIEPERRKFALNVLKWALPEAAF